MPAIDCPSAAEIFGYGSMTGRTRALFSASTNVLSPSTFATCCFQTSCAAVERRSGRLPASTSQRASCAGSVSHLTNSCAARARAEPLSNSIQVSGPAIVTGLPLKVGSGTTP